jgi:hypothetical protein
MNGIQIIESCALLCIPSGVSTDPLTLVSLARVGRGGRCSSLDGPCSDRQSVAHREAKPGAKTVGVARSSCRPIPVLWFSCTLVVLWILLLSLVTVGKGRTPPYTCHLHDIQTFNYGCTSFDMGTTALVEEQRILE